MDPHRLLILGFRLVHNLNVKRIDMDAYLCSNREHVGAVDKPLKTAGHDLHLVMYTLKDL